MMMQRAKPNGSEGAGGSSSGSFDSQPLRTIEDVAKLLRLPVSSVHEQPGAGPLIAFQDIDLASIGAFARLKF